MRQVPGPTREPFDVVVIAPNVYRESAARQRPSEPTAKATYHHRKRPPAEQLSRGRLISPISSTTYHGALHILCMSSIDRSATLRVAAEAECDPRTVATYADGGAVRDLSRHRIERALRQLGRGDVILARQVRAAQREVQEAEEEVQRLVNERDEAEATDLDAKAPRAAREEAARRLNKVSGDLLPKAQGRLREARQAREYARNAAGLNFEAEQHA